MSNIRIKLLILRSWILKDTKPKNWKKENPNMKSLIRQHLVFINWPADLIVKSYDPRDLFHFSFQVHFLCCYVNGECRFSWSARCKKNSVFFKFPGWQFLLPPLPPSHVCHVALPPRGNKSMQQQGNTIECALYCKDKYTLKHKYKYLLPCSPKQCGSECLLENSHRNLIQPFIRCSRRQQPPW